MILNNYMFQFLNQILYVINLLIIIHNAPESNRFSLWLPNSQKISQYSYESLKQS